MGSQSVTVSLQVDSLGSYSQDLLITHTEGQTETVSVRAEVEALAAATSTQVLAVSGVVSGVVSGQAQVKVRILRILNKKASLLKEETRIVERNGYRLTLIDLTDPE